MANINRTLCNNGINIGISSRLDYDQCYINDSIYESTSPLQYQLNSDRIYNCNGCISRFGPRPSAGFNANAPRLDIGNNIAASQGLVDLESVLTNRNVKQSKCKNGKVNPIDVTSFSLQQIPICNNFLDPISSHLTNPPQNYRGLSVNRFYDLNKDPQANIYYDSASNTRLEAKDNYVERIPRILPDMAHPIERKGPIKQCLYVCQPISK